MPCMKLKTRPVTSSQPPQSSIDARVRSVRAARARHHEPGHHAAPAPPGAARRPDRRSRRRTAGVQPVCAPAVAAADAAGLVAGQPAEAVVAEDELEDAVVLRAADVGPHRGRDQLDHRDPPAGRHQQRGAGGEQADHPAAQRASAAATSQTSASAGTTSSACSILVMNPRPTSAPASDSQRMLAVSTARTVA